MSELPPLSSVIHNARRIGYEAAAMLEHATFESHYPAQYPGVGHSAEETATRQPGTTGRQRGFDRAASSLG